MADKPETLKSPKIVKAECPSCGKGRRAAVHGVVEERWEDEHLWQHTQHRLLQCQGCEKIYYQQESQFSEDCEMTEEGWDVPSTFRYWPKLSTHKQPDWKNKLGKVDEVLSSLLDDVYTAHDHELAVLTAIGMRTAFDRATSLVRIDPELSFNKKLDQLMHDGRIGKDERQALDALTDAGNAAAHRAWRPSAEQLTTMLLVLEGFLHRTFVYGADAQKLKHAVPPRPKPPQTK